MTTTTTACGYGCRLRGEHLATCDGRDTRRPDKPCKGCIPRPSADGLTLCAWCARQLERDVASIPALVAHLHAEAQPHVPGQRYDAGARHGDPAERPVLSGALDAADELHAALASWARLILDEHPNGHQMTGPDETGARRTISTVRTLDGEQYVQPGDVAGAHDPAATQRLVDWITPWLPWCEAQEWAAEMRRELGTMTATARAHWPAADDVEPARRVDVPCPGCESMSLTYTPPRYARQAFRVECDNPDCARVYSEDEFETLKALAIRAARGGAA